HDYRVTWHCLEIFPAQAQRLAQVGQFDFANGICGGLAEYMPSKLCDAVRIRGGHGRTLPCSRGDVKTTRRNPRVSALMCESRGRAGYGKPKFIEKELSRTKLVATCPTSLALWDPDSAPGS